MLGSIRSSEAGSTLVSPPPSDWRVRALQISRDFQAHAGDPDRSDPDPATTVDPNPTATALERCARALSPAGYGGLYHRGSAYFVGFTGDVDLNLSRLHAAFPDVEVSAFLARHSWDELRRISHAITGLMTESSTAGHILAVGPDEVRNIVEVEVRDGQVAPHPVRRRNCSRPGRPHRAAEHRHSVDRQPIRTSRSASKRPYQNDAAWRVRCWWQTRAQPIVRNASWTSTRRS